MSFKVKDHYFKKAKEDNYLARSVYKLQEIDKKYNILKNQKKVIDLGYYPGSWLQYTQKIIGRGGDLIGVDIQEVNEKLIKKDFPKTKLFQKSVFDILDCQEFGLLEGEKFTVVLSDMAPKTTGVKLVDQQNSLELTTKIFELLPKILEKEGHLVVKVFEGNDIQKFLKDQNNKFEFTKTFRPKAIRSSSKECYFIGKNFKNCD